MAKRANKAPRPPIAPFVTEPALMAAAPVKDVLAAVEVPVPVEMTVIPGRVEMLVLEATSVEMTVIPGRVEMLVVPEETAVEMRVIPGRVEMLVDLTSEVDLTTEVDVAFDEASVTDTMGPPPPTVLADEVSVLASALVFGAALLVGDAVVLLDDTDTTAGQLRS